MSSSSLLLRADTSEMLPIFSFLRYIEIISKYKLGIFYLARSWANFIKKTPQSTEPLACRGTSFTHSCVIPTKDFLYF